MSDETQHDSITPSAHDLRIEPTLFHLTVRAKFRLDPKIRPRNNTTLGGDWVPGIFLGPSVEFWVNGYGYWRPWVVEFDVTELRPEDVAFSDGRETFVRACGYPRLHVKRIVPLDAHCRETFGDRGWTESFFGTDFHADLPLNNARGAHKNYTYQGDVRQEAPEWRRKYAQRVKRFALKSGRASGCLGR